MPLHRLYSNDARFVMESATLFTASLTSAKPAAAKAQAEPTRTGMLLRVGHSCDLTAVRSLASQARLPTCLVTVLVHNEFREQAAADKLLISV
jgi:hypothetical protein